MADQEAYTRQMTFTYALPPPTHHTLQCCAAKDELRILGKDELRILHLFALYFEKYAIGRTRRCQLYTAILSSNKGILTLFTLFAGKLTSNAAALVTVSKISA